MTVPRHELDSRHINRALGLFLLVFGLVILFSVVFTVTRAGMITNLIAGSILCAVGAGMVWMGRRKGGKGG